MVFTNTAVHVDDLVYTVGADTVDGVKFVIVVFTLQMVLLTW